jgi:prevent-host-death family protein
MIVNSTKIKNNFGKYLELASEQEIVITKNGSAVARLIGMEAQKKTLSEQLRGIIPAGVDEKSLKAERMSRH